MAIGSPRGSRCGFPAMQRKVRGKKGRSQVIEGQKVTRSGQPRPAGYPRPPGGVLAGVPSTGTGSAARMGDDQRRPRMTASSESGTSVPAADHKRVGFIGLGHMGSPMARRLVDAGYDVTVWSRTTAHVDDLVAYGATRADSPADAIAAGHVFSMLANESVLRTVLPAELLRAAPPGFIHVNHATISARAAEEFAARAADDGYGYVAAPVIGRPGVAAAGALTILAAGPPEATDASMPMLEVMGRRVWRYGSAAAAASLAK